VLELKTELPKEIIIEERAIEQIPNVIRKLGNFESILMVSGKITHKLAGVKISKLLIKDYKLNFGYVEIPDEQTINDIKQIGKTSNIDLILGIGGGKNIDVARAVAYNLKIPYISIPTVISHDGIASDRSIISRGNSKYPLIGKPPLAVIADLDLLTKAPFRYFAAGCGDVIAKYTAVLDWQLARDEVGEDYDKQSADISLSAAKTIINMSKNYRKNFKNSVKTLTESLISCGIAMAIAKSSRPGSGAEHMFCHTIDHLYPKNTALHGEKVGLGTYIMSFLHEKYFEIIKDALFAYNLPMNSKQIKIPEEILIKALSTAHSIRSDMRYTILKHGIKEKDAEKLLKEIKVI
jgi:glycerol-1-phosphate dehydrogenase [NAD(P)+]